MNILLAAALSPLAAASTPASEPGPGLVINVFWVVVATANFLLLLFLLQQVAFGPIGRVLEDRRLRIEQGLRDADAARNEREQTALDRNEVLSDARREANEILQRAQKAAEESRARDLEAARVEIERLRQQAADEIDAERQRALADVRSQIADLALSAASRVVGETMTADRERRLVEQFLAETSAAGRGGANN